MLGTGFIELPVFRGHGIQRSRPVRRALLSTVTGAALLCAAPFHSTPARAADFTVSSGVTDTVVKTLNAGETGTVEAGGVLDVSAANTITASGDAVSITNNGAISTTGAGSLRGISSTGTNATIINNGTISNSSTGIVGRGIFSSGTNATISNSGTISSSNSASGIRSTGDNATISNSGTISTGGSTADGISSAGANSTITHSGTITTVATATGAGIRSSGADGTITISGSVRASGNSLQAIVGSNNQTLNLMPGATIVGTIDLGGGTNVVNVFTDSGARSSTLTIVNAGNVSAAGGDGIVVQNGNTVAIVDPTNLTANRTILGAVTAGVHQAVSQQLAQANTPQPVQLAALTSEPGMRDRPRDSFVWARGFGGHKTRDDDGAVLAHESDIYGTVVGYETAIGDHSIGVLGGASRAAMKTEIASVETRTQSSFTGVYGEYVFGNWALGGTLVAGYEVHDSERKLLDNLAGSQTALSDYDSYYLSPSVTLARSFALPGGWTLRPSAEVNYTLGYYPGYTETGTTASNLTIDAHTIDVVGGRAQLAARHIVADGKAAFEYRVGATYTHYGRDAVDLRLGNGATVRHEGAGATSSQGGYGGVNARYDVTENLTLVADAEIGRASKQERSIIGSLGLELRF